MPVAAEEVLWGDRRSPQEIVNAARKNGASALLLEPRPGWISRGLVDAIPPGDHRAVVVCDPASPATHFLLHSPVAAECKFLALPADRNLGVVVSLRDAAPLASSSRNLNQLVILATANADVVIAENENADPLSSFVPSLTNPETTGPRWLREQIQQFQLPRATATQLTALRAGLFLLNDFLDESHSCSQSLEGLGPLHTGDYWHAILHRREPDYSNSKYWFRHVGRHPAMFDLAQRIPSQIPQSVPALAAVLRGGTWDAMAFVDLCSQAEDNRSLKSLCEQVQFLEMLTLLEATYREASPG